MGAAGAADAQARRASAGQQGPAPAAMERQEERSGGAAPAPAAMERQEERSGGAASGAGEAEGGAGGGAGAVEALAGALSGARDGAEAPAGGASPSASNSASAGAGGKRRSRSGNADAPYFGRADFGAGAGGRSVAQFWAAENWHASYVRTRQKNLRCFPFCSSTHKEHSFCGESIRVLVTVPSSAAAMSLSLEGCFRKVKENPQMALGMPRSALRWTENEQVSGCLSYWDPFSCVAVFDFPPSRTWRYRCSQNKHNSMDGHAFTVATFDTLGVCVDLVDSPHFRIVSAWLQNISSVARPVWGMTGSAPLLPGSGGAPRRHAEVAGWSEQSLLLAPGRHAGSSVANSDTTSGVVNGAGVSGRRAHEVVPGAALAAFARMQAGKAEAEGVVAKEASEEEEGEDEEEGDARGRGKRQRQRPVQALSLGPFLPLFQGPLSRPMHVPFNPPTQGPFLTTGGVAGVTNNSDYLALRQTQELLLLQQRQLMQQFLALRQHDQPRLAPSDKSVLELEEQLKKDGAGLGAPQRHRLG